MEKRKNKMRRNKGSEDEGDDATVRELATVE